MTAPKFSPATLVRLFDAAPDPLYLLDPKRTIVYCNPACAAWLGLSPGDLIGRRVDYTAGEPDAGPPGVAAGLCPPPSAFAGAETAGHVSCLSRDGRLVHRRARFVPLGQDPAQCEGVMAFVAAVDLPPEDLSRDLTADDSPDQLHREIRRFRARQKQRYGWEQLLGRAPAMKQVRAQVALAADSPANVLIVGPPGSGRVHVAHSIFYQSLVRRAGKLLPVEAAQPGVEALRQAVATLHQEAAEAQAGTLLLLDVDQAPPAAQSLLVELLAASPRRFSVLATARERLIPLAEQGRFHEELARALSTLEIELPALAQRMTDLPLLAQAFVERLNAQGGKQLGGVASAALDRLALHQWPGNLTELADVIAAAHVAARNPLIEPDDLPVRLRHAVHAASFPPRREETIDLEALLGRIEVELIERALARAKNNKTKAAKLLGMTRPRFYRRLEALGLLTPEEAAEVPDFKEE